MILQSYKGGGSWWDFKPDMDDSGIPVVDKLALLKIAHEQDLSHTRGRDGVVQALKAEGKTWVNMQHDAAWVIYRCEACRKTTTSDMAVSISSSPAGGTIC